MHKRTSAAPEFSGTLESFDPATDELVGKVREAAPEDVEEHVRIAWKGFEEWSARPLDQRKRVLAGLSPLILAQAEDIAALITREMGKPYAEAFTAELEPTLDLIAYYVRKAHKFLDPQRVRLQNPMFWRRRNVNRLEPMGVLAIITPWNWPFLIPMGQIVPALLAGNAVVFKPSEHTPLVGERIRSLLLEAGVSEAAFQIVHGFGEAGKALVGSSVSKVFFTGSTRVGELVMQQAARDLKRVVLELGGNDPAIVCADADLENASSGILWGGFNNCGQNCNGVERVYVHESVIEPFLQRFLAKVGKLRLGRGMEPNVDIGPLANLAQFEKTQKIVREALGGGAELLAGGKPVPELGPLFFQPTVLKWPSTQAEPEGEEIFGPVVFVTPFATKEEALRAANRSKYGLTASLWTQDMRKAEEFIQGLDAGTVLINDCVVSFGFPEAAWTGWKKSGVGWVHGEKGLDEMVRFKFATYEPQSHSQKFWWFPYGPSTMEGMRAAMQFLFARSPWQRLKAVPATLKHLGSYLLFNRPHREKL